MNQAQVIKTVFWHNKRCVKPSALNKSFKNTPVSAKPTEQFFSVQVQYFI